MTILSDDEPIPDSQDEEPELQIEAPPVKRGRGRPKGVPGKTVKLVPRTFFDTPETAEMTCPRQQLTQMLLVNKGRIKAKDELWWEIKSKPIGAGVYRVWLEKSARKVWAVADETADMPTFESDCLLISEAVRG